jgi:hypothetical protein
MLALTNSPLLIAKSYEEIKIKSTRNIFVVIFLFLSSIVIKF